MTSEPGLELALPQQGECCSKPVPQQHIQGTVIIQTPVGPHPTRTVCPSCRNSILTRINYATNQLTHLMAILLCFGCCWCFCVPYCFRSCKGINHYCPDCDTYIGTYGDGI